MGVFVLGLVLWCSFNVFSSFAYILYFNIVFLLSFGCPFSVSLPRGAIDNLQSVIVSFTAWSYLCFSYRCSSLVLTEVFVCSFRSTFLVQTPNSCEKKLGKIVSEYDHEIPQSQTADKPMAPQGRATQPSMDTRETN